MVGVVGWNDGVEEMVVWKEEVVKMIVRVENWNQFSKHELLFSDLRAYILIYRKREVG